MLFCLLIHADKIHQIHKYFDQKISVASQTKILKNSVNWTGKKKKTQEFSEESCFPTQLHYLHAWSLMLS